MKLLRQTPPDPQQLSLQLDFSTPEVSSQPAIDQPVPKQIPGSTVPGQTESLMLFPPPNGPTNTTPSKGKRRVHLRDHILEYRLLRSKRRSIGFLIDEDGLRITAPRWVTVVEIENAIREKQRWIFTKINERRERAAQRLHPQLQWTDGATLPYLGANIVLRIGTSQTTGLVYDTNTRELAISLPLDATEQQLKDRVQGWLQMEAKRLFAERLPLYAEKLDVSYRQFTLSSATTQWGSCTADGKIRLNWRLIHFALPLIDYVIAHELAHLREMNHGPRFWATVQSIFPGFQEAKKALREHIPETLPIF